MAWPKGQPRAPGVGRAKGTPNKVTSELKAMILGALEQADPKGGQEYLRKQALANPTAFMALLGKVLPSEIKGAGENGEIIIEIVKFANTDTR